MPRATLYQLISLMECDISSFPVNTAASIVHNNAAVKYVTDKATNGSILWGTDFWMALYAQLHTITKPIIKYIIC
jgi:hypothetical protein